ncbi:unnamed protein product [Arctogadus glacialis]
MGLKRLSNLLNFPVPFTIPPDTRSVQQPLAPTPSDAMRTAPLCPAASPARRSEDGGSQLSAPRSALTSFTTRETSLTVRRAKL